MVPSKSPQSWGGGGAPGNVDNDMGTAVGGFAHLSTPLRTTHHFQLSKSVPVSELCLLKYNRKQVEWSPEMLFQNLGATEDKTL